LAVLLTLIGAPQVHAQQQIQFFASVVDTSGTPVPGLTVDDFTVTENGAEGKVVKVEPIDWPIKVSILVDNGVGMEPALTRVRNGVRGLLEALPDGVEISLLTTAPQPRFIRRPTTDRRTLLEGVDLISPEDGAARFVEGLSEVAARLDKDRGNYFPVVIILGSTTAEGSSLSERDARRMLDRFAQRAATVHVVLLTTSARSSRYTGAGANQISVGLAVAKTTGGRYESIAAATRIATLLPELGMQVARSHALQSRQYRITAQRPAGASGPLVDFGMSARPGMVLVLTQDGHLP
jgi:hypothetical protein